jgi:hypothetical protein
MIYIIIPLLIITLTFTGIIFYSLEVEKVERQPTYIEVESNEKVLERLSRINQD